MGRLLVTSLILANACAALGSAGGGDDHHDIPWMELIVPQIVNFTIVVVGLIILLKAPIRQFFKQAYEDFEASRRDAEKARSNAELRHGEVKKRIAELEATSASSVQEATENAKKLKEKIISDAHADAQKITQESERMAGFELHRAVAALKRELIDESLLVAEKELKAKAEKPVLKRLNDEFVEKIRVVRS